MEIFFLFLLSASVFFAQINICVFLSFCGKILFIGKGERFYTAVITNYVTTYKRSEIV